VTPTSHRTTVAGFALAVLALLPGGQAASGTRAAERTVFADDLGLRFDETGNVTGVTLAGRPVALKPEGGFRVVEVVPGGREGAGGVPARVRRTTHSWTNRQCHQALLNGGWVRLALADTDAGLTMTAIVARRDTYIEVAGEIADTTGRDRALIVSFTLPVSTAGATFENTLREHYRLTGRNEAPQGYEGTRHVGRFNALRHSNGAFTALTFGRRAIAMAVPLHEPRLFVMKAVPAGLRVAFHLGVSPLTKKFPQRASFRFILYAVDPKWGIRDAAAKYYAFFPDLFRTRCTKHGNWGELGAFAHRFGEQRPEAFAFQFGLVDVQWRDGRMRPSNAAFMRRTGVYAFHHREPWGWWHDQRDYAAKKDDQGAYPVRKQTAAQEMAEIRQQAAGTLAIRQGTNQLCGCSPRLAAQAALNSHAIHYGDVKNDGNQDLTMLRGLSGSYGCSQIAMNLDPELPKPNRAQIAEQWQFRYFLKWKDRGRTDPHGISWDSLTDWTLWRWINFRREHFATADHPLVYSPRDARLGRLTGFQNLEWAASFSRTVHAVGGMVYVNTGVKEILFAAPYVDAFGIESTLDNTRRYGFEELSMLRCSAYQKPISFYRAADTTEAGIRRGVLFGIFPGVAGVKEGQRALYAKYMPAMRAAAEAGWEPVTHATVDPAAVLIERFGGNEKSKDAVYFALYNDSDERSQATLTIDLAALGFPPVEPTRPAIGVEPPGRPRFRERIENRSIRLTDHSASSRPRDDDPTPRLTLEVNPHEALLLRVGK